MDIGFKTFLLNEDIAYLGQRVGDILNASQELADQGPSMGTRQQVKNAEGIVNQIRRILHSDWKKEEEKYLKTLQKVGVAIMRAIEEKDDLSNIINSANEELTKLQGSLGSPAHSLGTPEKEEKAPSDKSAPLAKPQGEEEQPPEQNQQSTSEAPDINPGAEPGSMPPPGGMPGMPMQPGPTSMPQM